MNKEDALKHFEATYVVPKTLEKLFQTEEYYHKHRDELGEGFIRSYGAICRNIKEKQVTGDIGKVGYIHYSLLRSSLIVKRPSYRIDVYNKEWYFDPDQKELVGEYDEDRIFSYLDELEKELEEDRKRYMGLISPADLESIKLREAAKFNHFIIDLADYALNSGLIIPDFNAIAKEDEMEVRVGEYYDASEVVYKEDQREKNSDRIKEWFEDKYEDLYVAEVLKNLDLSAGDYQGLDLRRVDFRGSNLAGSKLRECLLIKTRFADGVLNGADLSQALIYDADFSRADLKNAVFFQAEGSLGLRGSMIFDVYSLSGVKFVGADLEKTNFQYANLQGADFRGAHFKETDFSGANLKNAFFNKVNMNELDLSMEQKVDIVWVEHLNTIAN
jgi:hypothetical protein